MAIHIGVVIHPGVAIHPGAVVAYGELNTSRGIDNDSSGVIIALQPANGH